MVVRQAWFDSLSSSKYAAMDKADRLVQTAEQPGDIQALAQRLGAAIVSLPENAKGSGYLAGGYNRRDWVISIKGDVSGDLSWDQRFAVAHELAHLLLFEARMTGPCGKEEYWLMEEVCDRIANILLSPAQ